MAITKKKVRKPLTGADIAAQNAKLEELAMAVPEYDPVRKNWREREDAFIAIDDYIAKIRKAGRRCIRRGLDADIIDTTDVYAVRAFRDGKWSINKEMSNLPFEERMAKLDAMLAKY